ncbi:MAG: glutathione S-transferase C-terminal domain-containing protein [Myxococcales bacterium]|nr:glutathione S-transferase C-terminal domain-containing protein [Myxococcales bacterium]
MVERTQERLSAEESLVRHLVAICERGAERPENDSAAISSAGVEGGLKATQIWARNRAPHLFPKSDKHDALVHVLEHDVIGAVAQLGRTDAQGDYEARYVALQKRLEGFETTLTNIRFLLGNKEITYADCLLFVFLVRLNSVYFDLFKATFFLLEDRPALFSYCRDLIERREFFETTDLKSIKTESFLGEPVLNSRGITPLGGEPDFHQPHDRHLKFSADRATINARGTEEDQKTARAAGEWVRGVSALRRTIESRTDAEFPSEAGRYHLFAPYNCPWSHRALLGRSVKGLSGIIGASVVYFRRHPDHGWQFNEKIPGCTADQVGGERFLRAYYEKVDSTERSAPVLWDTKTNQIVNNESADILRMFNRAFDDQLGGDFIDLVPAALETELDELNELIYQRINNGAYKAGFAGTQAAYERAYHRYFSALQYLNDLLSGREFLLGTVHPTEADLRLFPTIFRHDAVYYARFKLNHARIIDYPELSAWLATMLDWPGVREASNLDHARNGYFGRTGNGIVPAGPVPLELSPSAFSREVWLGDS